VIHEITIDGVNYVAERAKPPEKKTFAECVRSFREAYRWSLEEACIKIGISKTYLWELETDAAREPSFRLAVRIAKAYNIDLVYLASTLDQ
jgi:transcriptional regulator with XRE-family HTH domain